MKNTLNSGLYRQRGIIAALTFLFVAVAPFEARAETLRVGQGQTYATPCEAVAAAREGDVIEIGAGEEYSGAVCAWNTSGLTLRGVGGRARVVAGGRSADDQGIWVINGDNTTIENIEFRGAVASDGQGSAIRLNGRNLTVRSSAFFENENGLVTGDSGLESAVQIDASEFARNGGEHGQGSNISIGRVGSFTLQFSYSHHAIGGSLVSSRAAESRLLYNRLTAEDGSASREVAFPEGGRVHLIGNVIQKSRNSSNPASVGYLADGPGENYSSELRGFNNTFVSNYESEAVFVEIAEDQMADVVLKNNIFNGAGRVTNYAEAQLDRNLVGADPIFLDPGAYDYRVHSASPAVDAGAAPEAGGARPEFSYGHVGCRVQREDEGAIDIGAFAAGAPSDCELPAAEVAEPGARLTYGAAASATASLAGITLNPPNPTGGAWTTTNTVTLSAPAPAGGALVTIVSSNPSVAYVGNLLVPAGVITQTFMIRTVAVTSPTAITISASYGGVTRSATLTVGGIALSSVMLSPAAFGGGLTTTANQVFLSGPAPPSGATITLSSSNPSVAWPPSKVTIPGGVSSSVFNLSSKTVSASTSATITATFNGSSKNATATVQPVMLIGLASTLSSSPSGCPNCMLRISLNGPAPAGGAAVSLTSSVPSAASVPATVTIPAGEKEKYQLLSVKWVTASTPVVFSATYLGATQTAATTVAPIATQVLMLSPSTVKDGTTTTTHYVRLNGRAPSGGTIVTLSSSNVPVAKVPASVTVAAGGTTAYFSITTAAVGASTSVKISAAYGGTKSGTLTVVP